MYDEVSPFVPQQIDDENIPLSDQAAVEREAHQWATVWCELDEYSCPTFNICEEMFEDMLPEAIRVAVKTFPADMGQPCDQEDVVIDSDMTT